MDSVRELICAYYADHIDETEFISQMLQWGYHPAEILAVIDSKDEAQEDDLEFVTLH